MIGFRRLGDQGPWVGLLAGLVLFVGALVAAINVWPGTAEGKGGLLGGVGSMGQAIAVSLALVVAGWQLVEGRRSSQVDRVLRLHHELTSGEIALARHRLTSELWTVSPCRSAPCEVFGASPTYAMLRTQLRIRWRSALWDDSAFPGDDLYRLLWSFERAAEAYDKGHLDRELFRKMLGAHVIWWNRALDDPPGTGPSSRQALSRLAAAVWHDEGGSAQSAGWRKEIENDFGTR